MKHICFTLLAIMLSITAWSQKHSLTIGGGHSFASIDGLENAATGFRINGLYELNPKERKLVHGFSLGYIQTKNTVQGLLGEIDFTVRTIPLYYAPKYIFGDGQFRPFVKAALGVHFTNTELTGPLAGFVEDADSGFYTGLGFGFMVTLSEKMFLSADYEWAYSDNTLSIDRYINSIMFGVGFKL